MCNKPCDFASYFRQHTAQRAKTVLAFTLLMLCSRLLQADVIYRETFGRVSGATGNLNPSLFGWQHFLATGNAEAGNNGLSADGTGKPIDVANVNAGPNVDGSFDAQPEGWHYLDGTRRMSFTDEYSFNLGDYVPGSVLFSWHQGNAYTTAGLHLIVRLGGVWYVSVAGITNAAAVTAGANFGLDGIGAVPVSMAFNPAAANWNLLNFDGDFDAATTNRVNSTLGAPVAGGPAVADLTGVVTAFGLWRPNDNTGFGNSRFDSFTIEATPDTGTPPKNVRWEGGAGADWDTITANWLTNGGPATTFANRDHARLDDSATGPTSINLASAFQPGSVTVSNQALTYELGGSGALSGTTGLNKQGTGLLIVTNLSGNSYSGPTVIEQGTVQVGAGDVGGSLGSGTITNQGVLVLNRAGNLTLNNDIHGTGSLTQNGPGGLVLNGNSSYSGNTLLNAGTLRLNGNLSGGGQLSVASGTSLSGAGVHSGPVVSSGDISPGTSPGTLTLGALTLQTGATLTYEVGANNTIGGGVNDLVQVNGNLTLNNNSLSVALLAVPQTGVPYRVINFTGTRTGDLNPAVTIVGGGRFTSALSYDNGAGQVNLTFSGSIASLRWASSGDPNWDIGNTANWINQGNSQPDFFYAGDNVRFDDTPGLPTAIEIPTAVVLSPTSITVDSTNNAYSISSTAGGGRISGSTGIVKNGDSTLTLSTANDYTGAVTVNRGTLVVGNNAALGTTNGATTIASGATLDLGNPAAGANAVNLGAEHIFVGGSGVGDQGAIVNNTSTGQQNALQRVTLSGHTVWGGVARWDIRAAGASLSTSGNAYNLTKIGGNQINLVTTTVDPALANIEVQSGLFGLQTLTGIGNPTNTLTVFNGATLRLTDSAAGAVLIKVLIVQDGAIVHNTSGANRWGGPVTLHGSGSFNVEGTSLTITNVIGGTGGFAKITGGSAMFLTASNTFSGGTTVDSGRLALTGIGSIENSSPVTVNSTLDVSGRTDATFNVSGGQTLRGIGTINGSVLAKSGSTISPGVDAVGTLMVSNTITLQGTCYMEVDKASGNYDQVVASPILNFGGTLVVTNLSQDSVPLAVGDAFPLFSAVGYSSAFAGIVPATPGAGLAWDTSTLTTDGTLRVMAAGAPQPRITAAALSGGQFVLSGTNGTASGSYQVLTHTNIGVALSNWTLLGPFNFDSNGNFSFTNVAPVGPQRFYLLQLP